MKAMIAAAGNRNAAAVNRTAQPVRIKKGNSLPRWLAINAAARSPTYTTAKAEACSASS